jgi:hypothetical protein
MDTLKAYANRSREDQETLRRHSQTASISMVMAILQAAGSEPKLSEHCHQHALEYLSIELSIRDRKEIINVLCHSSPDHLTQSIRELVDAYEPVIRHMHNAINLSGTVGDMESFLRDMIKVAKVQTDRHGNNTVPTVGDFIVLLRKHQFSSHTFIHQCCKNGPEVTSWYLTWAKTAASHFKRNTPPKSEDDKHAAGDLTQPLQDLFSQLPQETQTKIIPILDRQTSVINAMHGSSFARLETVIISPPSKHTHVHKIFSNPLSRPSSRPPSRSASPAPAATESFKDPTLPTPHVSGEPGPGAYLARWQDLLDNTPITPLTPEGKVKAASSIEVVNASTADVDGEKMVVLEEKEAKGEKINVKEAKPDVRIVVEALGEKFRALLAEKSCNW